MNLLKAAGAVSVMTLLSRIAGLGREVAQAALFGAGAQVDAYEAAFRLPNLLRRLFAEGAFSQAFVPVLTEYQRLRGEDATKELVSKTSALLILILLIVAVAGVAAAPYLVYVLAGGFAKTPGKIEMAALLLRVVFPYILFISLVSLSASILNVYKKFAIPAATPLLLNVSIIACALLLSKHVNPPILSMAIGVALGGVLQLCWLIYPLAKIGMLVLPKLDFHDAGVLRILKLMVPALVGVSAAQISILINTQLAAYLGDGRIAWISYSDRLMEFPSALLGVALSTVLLPTLARHAAGNEPEHYSSLLDWGLRLALLLALPATIALCICAVPLISTLFGYGHFTAVDVLQTRYSLLGYGIGLPALILVKILAPGFYARQDIRTPVRISLTAIAFTQLVSISLVVTHGSWAHSHAFLTLAISLGAVANASLLFWQLRKKKIYTPQKGWLAFAAKLVIALAVFAVALYFMTGSAETWLHASAISKVLRLLGIVAGGIIVYFGALFCLGFRLKDFNRRD
jgi:putative peptidoglycan lipid II flippase